jgi:hypothetical protein
VGGDSSMNGRLFTAGDVSFNQRLFLGGDLLLNGRLLTAADVSMTGNVLAPTQSASDNSRRVATTAYVTNAINTTLTAGTVYYYGQDVNNNQSYHDSVHIFYLQNLLFSYLF